MLRFVIRKMLSKKWMVLSLLIGNILLASITAGNPMYTRAVLQRTLTKSLEAKLEDSNTYPGLITMRSNKNTKSLSTLMGFEEEVYSMPEFYGVDAVEKVRILTTRDTKSVPDLDRGQSMSLALSAMSDMPEHTEIIAGEMYSDVRDANGVVDAIISEKALVEQELLLGDVLTMDNRSDPEGNPLRVRIAGVFRNSEADDPYWVRNPSIYTNRLFISEELFAEFFMTQEELEEVLDAVWYVLLDYTAMRGDQAENLLAKSKQMLSDHSKSGQLTYADAFYTVLTEYLKTEKQVEVTLWVLQVPIFMLLAAFIFMVSSQMLDMEKNEIAVIKSRGAGRGQIFGMYLMQSLLISVIAYAVGIPLGVYICQVVGSANAFLEFVRRSALPVEVTKEALTYAGLASVLSICAMVLPAVRHSKTSIVNHKQRKHRSSAPLWQKLFLDVILLGVALYGLYTFSGQKDILASRVLEGASLDPILFLSSSMFMVGAGLLAVRLAPAIVWLVYRPFKKLWSPALYASFLRVLRSRGSQGFIMVFLIMTIALGVFNAQAARTINQNAEDNLRYTAGADIVVQEYWDNNADIAAQDAGIALEYREPDFGRYESLEGAASATKVYVNNQISASIGSGRTVKNVQLMGIHTKEFGETAWFKNSLSDVHWYNYLNAMAQNSSAILVSKNFQTDYECKLGDSISYKNSNGDTVRGVIYGFVDYFPGFSPVTYEKGADGIYRETENFLIAAHLSTVQSAWGVMPYQVWLKNKDGSDYFYDFVEENELTFRTFADVDSKLVEKKNDPVLQGTNGILTVGFIVVLVLCSVGFLIYWILSIQSRALQFGIFRAMGMSMREVITMLLNEQLFISGLSIAAGALVGSLTSKLYMPLIQIAYSTGDNALPLELISNATDSVRLFAVIGAVMLLCMVILGGLISRMKIAQALKLGED